MGTVSSQTHKVFTNLPTQCEKLLHPVANVVLLQKLQAGIQQSFYPFVQGHYAFSPGWESSLHEWAINTTCSSLSGETRKTTKAYYTALQISKITLKYHTCLGGPLSLGGIPPLDSSGLAGS